MTIDMLWIKPKIMGKLGLIMQNKLKQYQIDFWLPGRSGDHVWPFDRAKYVLNIYRHRPQSLDRTGTMFGASNRARRL